jgi:hypothetical protein
VKNPLRDEASAFRVVFLTLGGAVLVALGAWINTWLGVVVFLALVVVALFAIRGGMRPRPPQAHVVHDTGPARKILVVANETVAGGELHTLLGRKAEGVSEDVLVVCPALNSKLNTWTSDEDGARAAAQARLDSSLTRLREAGIAARGEIGDGDPLQALEDALREFPADEVLVALPEGEQAEWLEDDAGERARERLGVPIREVALPRR